VFSCAHLSGLKKKKNSRVGAMKLASPSDSPFAHAKLNPLTV